MKRGRTAASRTANVADAAEFTCTVKLTSKQADLFDVEKVVACRSVTVSNAVEDTGFDNPVPLPTVDSKILMKARASLSTSSAFASELAFPLPFVTDVLPSLARLRPGDRILHVPPSRGGCVGLG